MEIGLKGLKLPIAIPETIQTDLKAVRTTLNKGQPVFM